jgi:histidinol dehydrogenase
MKTYLKQAPPAAPQDRTKLEEAVRRMLADIARDRDAAVRRYARELDKWESAEFKVSADEIRKVERALPETFKAISRTR